MALDDAELKERLRKLGAGRLVDALCTLATRNDEAADYVTRLVSTSNESTDRIRRRLDDLAHGSYFVGYNAAYDFASDLEGLIEDIRMNVEDPEEGLELLCTFFKMDASIFERCDDSTGSVGQVFDFDAADAFVHFAKVAKDKGGVIDRVFELYLGSQYGVRSCLVERASEFLPKKKLRDLLRRLWDHAEKAKNEDFTARHALRGVEALARQLKDPALFEKARMQQHPDAPAVCCLDIAKVYAECREDDNALAWLERMPEDGHWRHSERDELMLAILKLKGEKQLAEEVAWRIFRRRRSKSTFDQFIELAGKKRRKSILGDEEDAILKSERFSSGDATFLVEMGLKEAAAKYLILHAAKLDGNDYWSLTPLAESMERAKQSLAASAVYRALLDSILARAQSKTYHHGAKYLRKLDAMAGKLSSWDPLVPHDEYKAAIVQAHRRKWRFWEEYGERPA